MNLDYSTYLLLSLAFVAANLPFLIERILFAFSPRNPPKNIAWRLLELILMFFVVGGFAWLLESRLGPVHRQNWEFYAVAASLFIVFAYPGFVYRYLWRRRGA